ERKITTLGLRYVLVTDQTSLVAVGETPSRPEGEPLTLEQLPIHLPAGWDFDTLFGSPVAHGQRSAGESQRRPRAAKNKSLNLPQTATNFATLVRRGLLLLIAGLTGLLVLRRNRITA